MRGTRHRCPRRRHPGFARDVWLTTGATRYAAPGATHPSLAIPGRVSDAELVEDGVTGFVVEPTGRAIAEAIGRLVEDRALAHRLGARGRELAAEFTWDRARRQLLDGVERAMSST